MWKKNASHDYVEQMDYQTDDYKALLRYINQLASHKLGYPVSLLTYMGVINNQALGIQPGTLANVLLNNVGDPFKDSETSLLEVKRHERKIIVLLEKFYGLARDDARGYVTTGGTEGNFAGLWWSKRFLINQSLNLLIKTDDAVKLYLKEEQTHHAILNKISQHDFPRRIEKLEQLLKLKEMIAAEKENVQQLLTPTVFYAKDHTHYSIPKIAEILHLNTRPVKAKQDGSIDLNDLKKEILLNQSAHPKSSIIVIANIGTTITGAIDDVPGINQILKTIQSDLTYTIHMDGALTGFVLPIIKPFGDVSNYFDAIGVNTLAVSAHKYPGLSQPCGIILAKRSFFEKAFEKSERSIDYVGNILDVTITGSRSGLNVLMFYHALCTLGFDNNSDKLNQMVEENLSNARFLYKNLVDIYGIEQVSYPYQFNIIFPRPSQRLAKKYQLMVTGDRATICVLTNVTETLINKFLIELKHELQNKTKEENIMNMIKPDYTLITLDEQHATSTVELFARTFCDSEPITKHLSIQYHDYEPFAREVINKAIKEGVSKIAIDKQDKVIACCIAEDIADAFMPKLTHYPKLKPIITLLNELSKPFLDGKKFLKGKVAHVWIAAVDRKYRGQGLSTVIDMACADLLARKGYDFVYAEFTNEISEKIINQYSLFQLCNKINYDTFTMGSGERPFKGVNGYAASYVIVIRPGIKLNALEQYYKTEVKY